MFKRLSILLFCITLSHADYTITSVDKERLTIEKSTWPIGTSGIILHQINQKHKSILARVEVISNEKNTQLKILPFIDLKQEALPTLMRTPVVGDTVRLGWMHDRILLVAPTHASYDLVMQSQKDKTFISPDLFAVLISKEGHPSPLKEDFKNFCKDYDIGLIEFIIGQKIFKVDAHAFKVIETIDVDFPKTKAQVPFYSRVKEIHADMWGEGSDEIKDYKSYYLSLLGEK